MVDIIPKPAPKEPRLLKAIFYISLLLLVLVFVVFFAFNYFVKNYQNKIAKFDESLKALNSSENINLQRELVGYQGKTQEFGQLIRKHAADSKIFGFIEATTHPKVWFSQFEASFTDNSFKLDGKAESFEALGQQILILRASNLTESVQLDQVALSKDGGINFSLTLSVKPEVLKF